MRPSSTLVRGNSTARLRVLRQPARRLHLHHRIVPADRTLTPPLIVLHGLFGSASNFNTPGRALAKLSAQRGGGQIVLADLRNHGGSPWDADCTVEAMASDVLDLIDALGAPTAALCGHSLGGKVAMAAALSAPQRVSKLVVVDIAPVTYSAATDAAWRANLDILDVMAAMPESVLGSRADADRALRGAGVADAGVRAFLGQNLLPDERRWRLNVAALHAAGHAGAYGGFPSLTELPAAPTSLLVRVIAGSRSPYCAAPEHRTALEERFPGAEDATHWLDCGHWVHAEQPDAFTALVDDFLAN